MKHLVENLTRDLERSDEYEHFWFGISIFMSDVQIMENLKVYLDELKRKHGTCKYLPAASGLSSAPSK